MDKYLVISTEFPPGPGGIGKHAYSLARGLAAHGAKVSIISDLDYATEEEIKNFIAANKDLDIHRIRRAGSRTYLHRITTATRLVKRSGFKKVIVTGKFPIWLGGLLRLRFGRKLQIEAFVHGSEARLASGIQKKLFERGLRAADKIWCVSNFTKSLLPADNNILAKTGVIANGLNIEDWPQSAPGNNPLQWKGSPRLLTVGNISPRKGQHCVIKALPEILKTQPDAHYHIVGMNKNAAVLETLASELGVANHITIHGKLSQEQLQQAYASTDVFCMLSENQPGGDVEGFGIAILEANIMGIPAIGSTGCGIEDAIKPSYNGYLANPHDAVAVSNALSEILSQNRDTLKANCKAWAAAHDWKQLVKDIL